MRRRVALRLRRSVCPALPPAARHTYKHHLRFTLLEAAAAGILANAPLMAIKGFDAADWQLTLRLTLSSLGMFVGLYAGSLMARRPKMPFVLLPGLAFAVCSILMGFTHSPLLFMIIFGVGAIFEVMTRPAITAVVRLNYPATHRGLAVGTIRKWSSLVFLAANMGSAAVLDEFIDSTVPMIPIQLVLAGLLILAALACFRAIQVREHPVPESDLVRDPIRRALEPLGAVRRDRRFRSYLLSCFLFGFGGLMYVAIIPAFFTHDLGYGYARSALLLHVLPGAAAFLSTGRLGAWFDRVSPWRSWALVRAGWGLDPLLLAAAGALGPLSAGLAVTARLCRGTVMGGSWVLWWQLGINHFAPPGGDTSRYMGVMIFLNGVMRLTAPVVGVLLLASSSRAALLVVGGAVVLLSAAHAYLHARREAGAAELTTTARFEEQFSGPPRA